MTESIQSFGSYRGNIIDVGQDPTVSSTGSENIIDTSPQQQEGLPEEQLDTMFTTGMLDQLNRLLGRAANHSFEPVARTSLQDVLKDQSLNTVLNRIQGGKNVVLAMADDANTLLKQLDQLHGMEAFAALFDNPVADKNQLLHMQAMNAQFALADTLRFIMNHMDATIIGSDNREVPNPLYEKLDEMQFKCNARAAEISRWAEQMQTLYNEQKDLPPEQRGSSVDGFSFDTSVSKALAELSARMHGTADGLMKLASSNETVRDFLKTLEQFAKSQETGEISKEDYETLKQQVKKFQKALKELAVNGWMDDDLDVRPHGANLDTANKIPEKDDDLIGIEQPTESKVQSKAWKLDSATLKKMAALLGKSLDQNTLCRGVLTVAMQRMIVGEMTMPKSLQLLAKVPLDILQKYIGCRSVLMDFYQRHANVLRALKKLVHNPCKQEQAQAQQAIDKAMKGFSFTGLQLELEKIGQNSTALWKDIQKEMGDPSSLSEEQLQLYSEYSYMFVGDALTDVANGKEFFFLQNDGELYKARLQTVMDYLDRDVETILKGSKTRQFLAGVFHGDYPVSSLMETRLHGVDDQDIQVEAEDAKLTDKKSLGEGSANEVFLCKYSNGYSFVFKPEMSGRVGLRHLALGGGLAYSPDMKLYHLNIATRSCAEAFGLENTIVTAKAGVLQGQFGFFMEVAPGKTMVALSKSKNKVDMKTCIEAKKDKAQLFKNMAVQFNNLQWLDMLTGQGDRHGGNLMMEISSDPDDSTVSLKGIDNDACFSEHRIGVNKYLLTSKQVKVLAESFNTFKLAFTKDERQRAEKAWNQCFIKQPDGTVVADVQKMKELEVPALVDTTYRIIGFQSCAMPSYITRALFDKLQTIKNMSQTDRDDFMTSFLGSHVTQKARAAFEKRLTELIDYAETLQTQGKVLDEQTDSWKQIIAEAKTQRQTLEQSLQQRVEDNHARKLCTELLTPDYFFSFMSPIGIEPDPSIL